MPVRLEDHPVLNAETLRMMKSLDDDRGIFLSELIDIFLHEAPPVKERLATALGEQSEVLCKKLAHKLKGMGANLGTTRLGELLEDIEMNYQSFDQHYRRSLPSLIASELELAIEHLRHSWYINAA